MDESIQKNNSQPGENAVAGQRKRKPRIDKRVPEVCIVCGTTYLKRGVGFKASTCSVKCRNHTKTLAFQLGIEAPAPEHVSDPIGTITYSLAVTPLEPQKPREKRVFECKGCHREFYEKKNYPVNYDYQYCSKPCFFASKKPPETHEICACGCGKPLITKSQYDYGMGRPRRFLNGHKFRLPLITKECLHCSTKFVCRPSSSPVNERRYCSKDCRTKAKRIQLHERQHSVIEYSGVCANCGKQFTIISKPNSHRRITCSDECAIGAGVGARTPSMTSPATQRKWMLANRPRKCERCGYDSIPEVIEVHHKDENRANGSPDNLEWVCPTCHDVHHFMMKTGRFRNRKGINPKDLGRKVIPENLLSHNERLIK